LKSCAGASSNRAVEGSHPPVPWHLKFNQMEMNQMNSFDFLNWIENLPSSMALTSNPRKSDRLLRNSCRNPAGSIVFSLRRSYTNVSVCVCPLFCERQSN
jgi:hypothetical protein